MTIWTVSQCCNDKQEWSLCQFLQADRSRIRKRNDKEISFRRYNLVGSNAISTELLGKIHGSGDFRRFKDTIYRRGIEDQWFPFRQKAFEEIAIDWLEENGIAYSRQAR
jgi:hypothetical protein